MDFHVSEIRDYKACRLYHDYGWRKKLALKKEPTTWTAMDTGIAIHHALAHYYESGDHPVDVLWAFLERPENRSRVQPQDEQLMIGMLHGYVEFARANDFFEVLPDGVEESLRIQVPGTDHFLVGTMDVRMSYLGRMWAMDHKTCANFTPDDVIELDEQMTAYLWLLWKKYGELPGGIFYNQLRKKTPELNPRVSTEFFHRTAVVKPPRELQVFERELTDVIREMAEPPSIFPTFTSNCIWWKCDFLMLCRARRQGGDEATIQEFNYVVDNSEIERK